MPSMLHSPPQQCHCCGQEHGACDKSGAGECGHVQAWRMRTPHATVAATSRETGGGAGGARFPLRKARRGVRGAGWEVIEGGGTEGRGAESRGRPAARGIWRMCGRSARRCGGLLRPPACLGGAALLQETFCMSGTWMWYVLLRRDTLTDVCSMMSQASIVSAPCDMPDLASCQALVLSTESTLGCVIKLPAGHGVPPPSLLPMVGHRSICCRRGGRDGARDAGGRGSDQRQGAPGPGRENPEEGDPGNEDPGRRGPGRGYPVRGDPGRRGPGRADPLGRAADAVALRAAAGELNQFADDGSFMSSFRADQAADGAPAAATMGPSEAPALKTLETLKALAALAKGPARADTSGAAAPAGPGRPAIERGAAAGDDAEAPIQAALAPSLAAQAPDQAPEGGLTAAQLALLEADEGPHPGGAGGGAAAAAAAGAAADGRGGANRGAGPERDAAGGAAAAAAAPDFEPRGAPPLSHLASLAGVRGGFGNSIWAD